jgi:uncharacterized protein (DUF488 family)
MAVSYASPAGCYVVIETISHPLTIFTVGHSNHSFEEFISLLEAYEIRIVADIRSFPGSRKFPHFNRADLEASLPEYGVEYLWIPKLGGRRSIRKGFESPNIGLTSPGFRAYADYMATEEFPDGVNELLSAALRSRTAYMCAEALYWRCHRRLLSDYLTAQGIEVLHIMGPKNLVAHKLSKEAVLTAEGGVIYPATADGDA